MKDAIVTKPAAHIGTSGTTTRKVMNMTAGPKLATMSSFSSGRSGTPIPNARIEGEITKSIDDFKMTLAIQLRYGLSVAEVASEFSGEVAVEVPHSNSEMDSGWPVESATDDESRIGLNDDWRAVGTRDRNAQQVECDLGVV